MESPTSTTTASGIGSIDDKNEEEKKIDITMSTSDHEDVINGPQDDEVRSDTMLSIALSNEVDVKTSDVKNNETTVTTTLKDVTIISSTNIPKPPNEPETNDITSLKEAAKETIEKKKITPKHDQLELKEAMAQLTQAINRNPNLSKAQEEFFRDMAKTNEPKTSSSIKSIHKAMEFLEDTQEQITKAKVENTNRDTDFHKSMWQAHEKGIVIKKLLEFAKEKKNFTSSAPNGTLEKPKFRRAASLPVGTTSLPKKTNTAKSVMRQQSLSSKQIIDELLTPRKSNVQPQSKDDVQLKPSVVTNNLLHLPDFESPTNGKITLTKVSPKKVVEERSTPAPLYVLPCYSTRSRNLKKGFSDGGNQVSNVMSEGGKLDDCESKALSDDLKQNEMEKPASYFEMGSTGQTSNVMSEGDSNPAPLYVLPSYSMNRKLGEKKNFLDSDSQASNAISESGATLDDCENNNNNSDKLNSVNDTNLSTTENILKFDDAKVSATTEKSSTNDDAVMPSEKSEVISNEEIEVEHIEPKKKNKSKQKLFTADRLPLSSTDFQIQFNPNLKKKHHRSNSLDQPTALIRESSLTRVGISGFEAIINNAPLNRSMSFDTAASSICTNDTEYTNDSLSSLYHLFTNLKTNNKRNDSMSSYPSLHRCDANDEGSLIDVTSPEESVEPPMFYRQQQGKYNYHEAFMTHNTLADDLVTVDDTVEQDDATNVTELNNAFLQSMTTTEVDDGETTPNTTQTTDTPNCTDVSISPQKDTDESIEQDLLASCSWSINTDDISHFEFDAWDIFHDEYLQNEKDELTFTILGTSADDSSAQPHVLSPPLMDSLKEFLPDRISHYNYWLKYSLVRDGANMRTLLTNIRTSYNTLFAIETTNGDVFGWFTTSPYKYHYGYFGQGADTFVWKMKNSRCNPTYSLLEQIYMESDIEVYSYTDHNDMIQVCKHDLLAIGGGTVNEVHAAPYDMNMDIVNSAM